MKQSSKNRQQTLQIVMKEHEKLLFQQHEEKNEVDIEQARSFLKTLSQAGRSIESANERSWLRDLMHYWTATLLHKTGQYQVIDLQPCDISTRPSKWKGGWRIATLVLAIITILLTTTTTLTLTNAAAPRSHPSATPSVPPRLESQYHEIVVNIDVNAFLSDNPSAANAFNQQIMSQSFLKSRQAGLVVVYGGAPDGSRIEVAQAIANKAYADLSQLGKQGPTFAQAAYYKPLTLLGISSNLVTIDIYLFAQS